MNQRYEDLIKDTKKSATSLMTAALGIPADKREWTPGGLARSTILIVHECSGFPAWIAWTLKNGKMPNEEESKALYNSAPKSDSSLEVILESLQTETDKLCETIRSFPESRLNEELTFPWGTYSMLGIMGFHYWNNTYHLGQINYLQLILGDASMAM